MKNNPLATIPDDGLLDLVRLIISMPGELTQSQRLELEMIAQEFERREPDGRREKDRARKKVERVRAKIKAGVKANVN
jgi:hypothetical protein